MLKNRVAMGAAIQISKYVEGLTKMHKYTADYTKALLEDLERATAIFEKVKIPSISDLLAGYEFTTAKIPNISDLLANCEFTTATFEKVKILSTETLLANLERTTATFEKAKEHRDNYVETYYNRDLAYRGKEETNHAIEDYNETVKLNLELEEKDIFGDGLAFAATEKEAPNNITFNIQQLIQKGGTATKVEITNSTVGLLNTGEMLGESITANISTLADFNQYQIAEALKNLTEVVKASQDISSQQRTEILEQLNLLSEQAILAPSERKAGLIKPILSTLATALSAGGGLAEIWSKWGNVIEGFFGIHG